MQICVLSCVEILEWYLLLKISKEKQCYGQKKHLYHVTSAFTSVQPTEFNDTNAVLFHKKQLILLHFYRKAESK